jgi:hypothetical protein
MIVNKKIKSGIVIKKAVFYGAVIASLTTVNVWASEPSAASSAPENKITLLTDLNNIKVTTTADGTRVITLPNDTKVIKKDGEAPYCLVGCDVAMDCKGNKPPAPTGKEWACQNKPGACVGTCYLTSTSN